MGESRLGGARPGWFLEIPDRIVTSRSGWVRLGRAGPSVLLEIRERSGVARLVAAGFGWF